MKRERDERDGDEDGEEGEREDIRFLGFVWLREEKEGNEERENES